jgi:transposase-like protein
MLPLIEIQGAIEQLPIRDISELESYIAQSLQRKRDQLALAKREDQIHASACIHCQTGLIRPYGQTRKGIARFKCRNAKCGKTFTATKGTAFYRLRKQNLWLRYISLMKQHIPLRDLIEYYGINLSLSTCHRWRHLFLSATLTANPTDKLSGVIEVDETFFRTNYKGSRGWRRGMPPQNRAARNRGGAGLRGLSREQVPVLTALDRTGAIFQEKLPDMRWPTIVNTFVAWIESESVICSDQHGAYKLAADQSKCEHMTCGITVGANSRHLSIGRINAYHRDVENLINRKCYGVATRYLMNYFAWQRRIKINPVSFGSELFGEMLAA